MKVGDVVSSGRVGVNDLTDEQIEYWKPIAAIEFFKQREIPLADPTFDDLLNELHIMVGQEPDGQDFAVVIENASHGRQEFNHLYSETQVNLKEKMAIGYALGATLPDMS